MATSALLSTPIEFLKGVGPFRADLLRTQLNLHTFGDLLWHFPYRHIDKTRLFPISAITPQMDAVQVKGRLLELEQVGEKRGRRLAGVLKDDTGELDLIWFQGIAHMKRNLQPGRWYVVYGKPTWFKNRAQLTHPEIELLEADNASGKDFLEPVYPTTEKLKSNFITGRSIGRYTAALLPQLKQEDVPEFLPDWLLTKARLMPRFEAIRSIHFPASAQHYDAALRRLKFEELFAVQMRLNQVRLRRHNAGHGLIFSKVGQLFNTFFHHHLPFTLTEAQKRVMREIRNDCGRGYQMNRLLQGDVGSGKTMVALLSILLAADNGFQSCLMAPTEILATQHFQSFGQLLQHLPLRFALLTGSTRQAERKRILAEVLDGSLHLLVGTHALIESTVQFKNLGLAVIDEQHRFGVEQRSKLWQKSDVPPHVLVMTATPIPRTLSMTLFGDLDCSIIDELPPGRQPVTTVHRYESSRHNVLEFVQQQIDAGRQAYIIFPLIEESDKLEYENLMRGYENVKAFFPEHKYNISMVHGRMSAEEKEVNMRRFVTGDTHVMVSTTVIEVGVNVPNATVMVIENAEKFGLSQLHQLRGRVGRGADKSYCVLLSSTRLSTDAKARIKLMCETNDGFKIAEKDMELRGPGDVEGTRQSGTLNFKLASLIADKALMEEAAGYARQILDDDIDLTKPGHHALRAHLLAKQEKTPWAKIS